MSMELSEFSSLIFKEYANPFQEQLIWMQTFAPNDLIIIQCKSSDNIDIEIQEIHTNIKTLVPYRNIIQYEGGSVFVWNVNIGIGEFNIKIIQRSSKYTYTESYFKVTDNEECLEDTVLIKYTNYKNNLEAYFYDSNNEQIFFEIRYKGGFKYQDISFSANSEYFRSQNYSPHQLSSFPYYSETLTIGKAYQGVPVWVGEKLNNAFSCSYVSVNKKEYVRSEGSIPELIQINSRIPLYIFKITLEPSSFYTQTIEANIKYLVSNARIQLVSNSGKKLIANTK